ncbi:MAG TPA: hypothetical protein VIM30_06350 [Candidatus Limnocylindrales bacterium]
MQAIALLVFLGIFYWFVSSGMLFAIARVLADWYSHQVTLPGGATPSATPA